MKRCMMFVMMLSVSCISMAALVTDGLIIHLDAGSIAGLNEGDAVTSWADSATGDSINGTVTQLGQNAVPTYQTNVVNGQAVVRFAGADVLNSADFSWIDVDAGVTVFAVLTGDSSGQTGERALGIGHNTGAAGQVVGLDVSTNTTEGDGGSGLRFNNGKELVKAANPLDTEFHRVIFQIDQGAQYQSAGYYVDDLTAETFDSVANGTNILNLPATGNALTVGTSWIKGTIGVIDMFSGDIAEILVYNKMLSAAEMSEVNDYLNAKYLVPEPATVLLMGLGAVSFLRKKSC